MKKIVSILLVSAIVNSSFSQTGQRASINDSIPPNLTITVNEGIELVSIVQYLGGQLANSTPSKYKAELKRYFLPYRQHAAVSAIYMFDETIYPDMVEWGLLFHNFPNIQMDVMPDSSSWYHLVHKEQLQNYLVQCMRFYKDTKFHDFYTSHKKQYEAWAAGLRKKIAEPVNIFNSYFNINNTYTWRICLDPLNDWGAHTIIPGRITTGYKNNIIYQLGYFGDLDSNGDMLFKTNVYDIAWHEGTHAVTDALLAKHHDQIDSLAYLLKNNEALKKQNITDWYHYFDELIARSVSIALHKKYRPAADYDRLLSFETSRGFPHAKLVSDVIFDEFINNKKQQSFDDVLPIIFKQLKANYGK